MTRVHEVAQTNPDGFDALADLVAQYPLIMRYTHFLLVPGPLDLTLNSILPRKPIMSSFTTKLKNKIPKIHFATNPCRIKFFDQEIVIFREDIMSKMLRNMVGAKPDVSSTDLKRYVSGGLSHTGLAHSRATAACSDDIGPGASEPSGFKYPTSPGRL